MSKNFEDLDFFDFPEELGEEEEEEGYYEVRKKQAPVLYKVQLPDENEDKVEGDSTEEFFSDGFFEEEKNENPPKVDNSIENDVNNQETTLDPIEEYFEDYDDPVPNFTPAPKPVMRYRPPVTSFQEIQGDEERVMRQFENVRFHLIHSPMDKFERVWENNLRFDIRRSFLQKVDRNGDCPLHIVCARSNQRDFYLKVKYLTCMNEVDFSVKNRRGDTPFDVLLKLPKKNKLVIALIQLFAKRGAPKTGKVSTKFFSSDTLPSSFTDEVEMEPLEIPRRETTEVIRERTEELSTKNIWMENLRGENQKLRERNTELVKENEKILELKSTNLSLSSMVDTLKGKIETLKRSRMNNMLDRFEEGLKRNLNLMDLKMKQKKLIELWKLIDLKVEKIHVAKFKRILDEKNQIQYCTICAGDDVRDRVLVPCGHTFCRLCCKKIDDTKGECPVCRKKIDKMVKIFFQ